MCELRGGQVVSNLCDNSENNELYVKAKAQTDADAHESDLENLHALLNDMQDSITELLDKTKDMKRVPAKRGQIFWQNV
ncbi:hypothetical protein FACS1894188_04500 [Clostridia bacterium]|nr:hypothetical protein FACS1894188_04500 [Clostridia bacterium]